MNVESKELGKYRSLFGVRLEADRISKWKYALGWALIYSLGIAQRVKTEGQLSERGAAILTINHLSYLDPPICYFVAARLAHRTLRMVARDSVVDPHIPEDKGELTKYGKRKTLQLLRYVLSFIASIGDPISMNRTSPKPSFIKAVDNTLKSGQILAISLQSTRNPKDDLLAVEEGAAFIALRHPDVPIYCAGISGSQLDLAHLFGRIHFRVGEPFTPRELRLTERSKDSSIQELTHEITRRTALLVPYELKRNYMAWQA